MTSNNGLLEAISPQPDIADPAFIRETVPPIKLNIGSGIPSDRSDPPPIPGYVSIDGRLGHDIAALEYADNSVDTIYASHVLEHVGIHERPKVLAEWFRVLKPGGRVQIAVPDMKAWATMYLAGRVDLPLEGICYGGQNYEHNYHKSGYDKASLTYHLDLAGFVGVAPFKPFHNDCSSLPWSLNLEAWKPPAAIENGQLPVSILASMSVPRLLFFDQQETCENVVRPMGISIKKHTGSNWGQCLERCFQEVVDGGYEYILAMDYDTVFSREQLVRLITLAVAYADEYDAVAPLQIKRDNNSALFWRDTERPLTSDELAGPIFSASSAHFGCTLIKTEFLKKMKHPWFHHVPAADGSWGDGRIDDDINFWKKFKEAGGRLGVTSRLCVGHLQLTVSWLGEGYEPVHQYVSDFRRDGPPVGTGHKPADQAALLVGVKGAG